MKLIANSLVPTNPLPYLHLGYFHAQTADKGPLLLFAFSSFAFIIISACIWFVIAIRDSQRSLGFKKGQRQAVEANKLAKAPSLSNSVAISILIKMQGDLLNNKAIPDDLAAYCAGMHLPRQVDGWDHSFRLVTQRKNARTAYLLISAGPDGVFDSPDDITWELTPDGKIEVWESGG